MQDERIRKIAGAAFAQYPITRLSEEMGVKQPDSHSGELRTLYQSLQELLTLKDTITFCIVKMVLQNPKEGSEISLTSLEHQLFLYLASHRPEENIIKKITQRFGTQKSITQSVIHLRAKLEYLCKGGKYLIDSTQPSNSEHHWSIVQYNLDFPVTERKVRHAATAEVLRLFQRYTSPWENISYDPHLMILSVKIETSRGIQTRKVSLTADEHILFMHFMLSMDKSVSLDDIAYLYNKNTLTEVRKKATVLTGQLRVKMMNLFEGTPVRDQFISEGVNGRYQLNVSNEPISYFLPAFSENEEESRNTLFFSELRSGLEQVRSQLRFKGKVVYSVEKMQLEKVSGEKVCEFTVKEHQFFMYLASSKTQKVSRTELTQVFGSVSTVNNLYKAFNRKTDLINIEDTDEDRFFYLELENGNTFEEDQAIRGGINESLQKIYEESSIAYGVHYDPATQVLYNFNTRSEDQVPYSTDLTKGEHILLLHMLAVPNQAFSFEEFARVFGHEVGAEDVLPAYNFLLDSLKKKLRAIHVPIENIFAHVRKEGFALISLRHLSEVDPRNLVYLNSCVVYLKNMSCILDFDSQSFVMLSDKESIVFEHLITLGDANFVYKDLTHLYMDDPDPYQSVFQNMKRIFKKLADSNAEELSGLITGDVKNGYSVKRETI